MKFKDTEIFILKNKRKTCLTENFLNDYKYNSYLNPDWDMPKRFKPKGVANKLNMVKKYQLGQFRCFRGHQEIWKMAKEKHILIFEDDANPNCHNWKEIVHDSIDLLDKYDIVSLHARTPSIGLKIKTKVKHKNNEYITLDSSDYGLKWALGSLCYLINTKVVKDKTKLEYTGIPIDLYLYNNFNSLILCKSCFDHDRKHGTLIGV